MRGCLQTCAFNFIINTDKSENVYRYSVSWNLKETITFRLWSY